MEDPKGFYEFGKDPEWMFQGYALVRHKPRIRWAFRWTVLVFLVLELILTAWPITATVLWGFESALTWIWFLYIPRVLFLLWALFSTSEVITLFGSGAPARGNLMRMLGAFAPSTTLAVWTVMALVGGVIVGLILLVITAATFAFFRKMDLILLYGLSLGIGVVSVLESGIAPFLVYRFGVYVPIVRAHRAEKQRMKRGPAEAQVRFAKPPEPMRGTQIRQYRGLLDEKRTKRQRGRRKGRG
jgi:hypothetical protein